MAPPLFMGGLQGLCQGAKPEAARVAGETPFQTSYIFETLATEMEPVAFARAPDAPFLSAG